MAGHQGGFLTRTSFDTASLPTPAAKRMAVRVTKDAERQIRGGHPWIFEGSITSDHQSGAPGDLAVVFDHKRDFLAIGLYDPDSPIRIKVLHSGKPRTVDTTFWRDRLTAAIQLRAGLVHQHTTGYRVINGENDGLPGLILDRYDTTYVLKIYSAAWFAHLAELLPLIEELLGPEALVLRWSRLVGPAAEALGLTEGVALVGETPDAPVLFLENGLTFEADVVDGQKTGHFLDQRDNRQRVRELSNGRSVLDIFSCTGGFSVYAAAGGARLVHSVDISEPAIITAERNWGHNEELEAVANARHRTTVGDAFDVMAQLAHDPYRYDIVIIDPPSFAKRATEVRAATKQYARLTELGLGLLAPGGLLVQASCSSRVATETFERTVNWAAQDVHRPLDVLATPGHAVDHPATFPEGRYLKAIFAIAG